MSGLHRLTKAADTPPERLDAFLAAALPDISRTRAQWLIREGYVTLGGADARNPAQKIKAGQEAVVTILAAELVEIKAVALPITILYEDAHLLVIDKAAGMTVHPAAGHMDDTLVNALLAYCGHELSGMGGQARPGIVHRLDKDTSGAMVVAKNDVAHRRLADQLMKRTLKRTYQALVWGTPKPAHGTITTQLARNPTNRKKIAVVADGGKHAVTHYTVLEVFLDGAVSLVECNLETGRTHQIRVHMAHLGHPLIGDQTYGSPRRGTRRSLDDATAEALHHFPRQALHAVKIGFIHPVTGETIACESSLPEDIRQLLQRVATKD